MSATLAGQQALITLPARLYLLLLAGTLFVLSGQYDPDFEGYRLIYDLGGSYLVEFGRDPAFVYIVSSLNNTLTYENFRYGLAAVFSIGLWCLAPRLANISPHGFGLTQALALTPLVLLKFHVQIREGLALLIWFYAVTSDRRGWRFWLLAALSCSIHVGAVILWAAVIRRWRPMIMFLGFALYGFAMTPVGRELLIGPLVSDYDGLVRDTGFGVDVTDAKIAFWSLSVVLPLLVVLMYSAPRLELQFARIGAWGLLGFVPVAILIGLDSGIGEGEFSNILRISQTLLMLLVIGLSMTMPGWALTRVGWILAVAGVIRLLVIEP